MSENRKRLTVADGEGMYHYESKYIRPKFALCGTMAEMMMMIGPQKVSNAYVNKLGKLEDLEDELGVPLLTIAKALKDGIWTLQDDFYDTLVDEPSFVEGKYLEIGFANYQEYEKNDEDDFHLSLVVEEKGALCLYTHEYEMKYFVNRLKDYGRTWALTKEELEK